MKFVELDKNETRNIEGGALAGALVGAILGGTGGLIVGCTKGITTGSLTGNELWKCYTSGAIAGGATGAFTPI